MRASYSQKNGLTLELTPDQTAKFVTWLWANEVPLVLHDIRIALSEAIFHGDTETAEERRLDAECKELT